MKLSRLVINAIATLALVFGGLVSVQAANAVASCTSPGGTADTSLVLCSDSGTFTARAPISSSGVIAQEIVMNIDPTKTSLSSANQIVAPAGWTVYYYNGSTWSSTAPSTPSGWAAISKVKASGTLISQGSANGKQIASNTATAVAPPSGAFSASGSGDGWSVFFDNVNHVFNVYHHDSPNSIDCHTRTGTTCSGNWPFSIAPYHTRMRATGYVDDVNRHLWVPTNTASSTGFVCVDTSNIATPTFCGGSSAAAYRQLGTGGPVTGNAYEATEAFAQSGTRLFTWERATGKLECLDMAANSGAGAACGNQPVSFAGVTSTSTSATLVAYDGKIYGSSDTKAICIDATTFAACSGWPITMAAGAYTVFPLPNASGSITGVCYVNMGTNPCYTLAGASLSRPSGFNITTVNNGAYETAGQNPQVSGSRVYWAENYGSATVRCWDMATAAACPNWPVSGAVNRYTVQVDPYNTQCIWTNGDPGVIQAWDALLGTLGCTSLPSDVTFDANLIIPRMGCNPTTAITEWQNFALTGPTAAKYSSATLSVTKSDGTAIAGWTNVPITGTRIVDLSTLSVADSGQQPLFKVHCSQRTGTSPADDAAATVTAIGDQPELCITPDQHYACPTTLGPINTLPSQTAAISASGTATLQGNTQQTFVGASTTTPITTPSLAACASTLSGTAAGGGGGAPVAGVTVTLLDSSGNPVLDSNNQPITAVTDSSGNYSFGLIAVGAYKVKFNDKSGTMTVSTATITSAGSGTTNAASGTVTSAAVTLVANTNGVVNAAYALPPIAPSRTQIAASSTNVVFNPFAAAPVSLTAGDSFASFASTGSNFTGTTGSTRLCSSSETPNNCTSTTVGTANGTYSVNTSTGVVTFTPNAGFVGTAIPVTYVVTDAATRKTSGVFTPVVAAPTVAVNDASWGQPGIVQRIQPIANDTITSGNALITTSVLLCSTGQTSPNCTATSITVAGQGTYTLDTTTGLVSFTPVLGFIGDATPISYQATDLLGSVVTATITPHVVEPVVVVIAPTSSPTPSVTASASPSASPSSTPSPSASTSSPNAAPDFKTGTQGTPVTVAPLGNDAVATGTVHICVLGDQSTSCAQTSVSTNDGTWTVHNDSTVTFMPADGFFGKASIGYRAKLATGKTVWSYITVTIPDKSGLAYTGGGDQQAMFAWMLALLAIGATLLRVAKRRS